MNYTPSSLNAVVRLEGDEVEPYLRLFGGGDVSYADDVLKAMITSLQDPVKPAEVAEDIKFMLAMEQYVARGDLPLPEEVFVRFSVPEGFPRHELGRFLPSWRNQTHNLMQVLKEESITIYSNKIAWLRLRAISRVTMGLLEKTIQDSLRLPIYVGPKQNEGADTTKTA